MRTVVFKIALVAVCLASIAIGCIPTLLLAFPVYRFMVRGLMAGGVR